MTCAQMTFEVLKLLLQGAGAILVAWLAVGWAFGRFKKEKRWEREVTALADIITALSELRRVYGQWMDEIEAGRDYKSEKRADLLQRFRAANRLLDQASALAALLLPNSINNELIELEKHRESIRADVEHDVYGNNYSLLDDAIHNLIKEGEALFR